MTRGGFGKTACTIWDSCATVPLISAKSSVKPDSARGVVSSGFGTMTHLQRKTYFLFEKSKDLTYKLSL